MRPRGMASSWVKHLPWYWAEDRRQPTRAAELERALHDEGVADDVSESFSRREGADGPERHGERSSLSA